MKTLVTVSMVTSLMSAPLNSVVDANAQEYDIIEEASYVGKDYPKRRSAYYGTFFAKNTFEVVAFLLRYVGLSEAYRIVSNISNFVPQNIYYSYTHTGWRTAGVTYVEGTIAIYSDSSYSKKLESATFNRSYQNDGLDNIEDEET